MELCRVVCPPSQTKAVGQRGVGRSHNGGPVAGPGWFSGVPGFPGALGPVGGGPWRVGVVLRCVETDMVDEAEPKLNGVA